MCTPHFHLILLHEHFSMSLKSIEKYEFYNCQRVNLGYLFHHAPNFLAYCWTSAFFNLLIDKFFKTHLYFYLIPSEVNDSFISHLHFLF